MLLQMQLVNAKLAKVLEKIETMEEVLQFSVIEEKNANNKLMLTGFPKNTTNPQSTVRSVLVDKLGLENISNHILTASSTEDGIIFDMRNVVDKKRILYRAQDRLADSLIQIIEYIKYDLDVRIGN